MLKTTWQKEQDMIYKYETDVDSILLDFYSAMTDWDGLERIIFIESWLVFDLLLFQTNINIKKSRKPIQRDKRVE